ncbi:PREDICTED: protein FLX-like 1 [Camelina sativa]|uniref:Protein FLX-like 1 n=1 Tax=Camelina sativa TaxID=90675 RepID=A0ABM0YJQ0_CAMSA|nr:PREDICTED: protein FLX-like 1 [Camelina sativa]XP_010502064.1 PREDICTED: protein FLX-like 1 [Camelina sativa]
MSGRNRGPPPPPSMNGGSYSGLQAPVHQQPPFVRGLGGGGGPVPPPPHPSMIDDGREAPQFRVDARGLPPQFSIMEDRLAAQNQDVQGLLADNQTVAAIHVALNQELEVAQHELQRIMHYIDSLRAEEEIMMREMYDKSMRSEMELREVDAMRAEIQKIRVDIKELTSGRQELNSQVHVMTQDLARLTSDLQQIPTLTAEIENTKQELQRARAAIDYEKKGYAENYEHGKIMEHKLVAMARELEKLRAEIANSESRAHATGPVGNPGGVAYGGGYGNPEAGYPVNPYQPNYVMNPAQAGVVGYYPPPYGPQAAWAGGYDPQQHQQQPQGQQGHQ